ncbi:TPA: hypothetical protein SH269_003856 [Pseudomonas aeruginosa]|nr:hypothetical protein [Pseudomonas aeruginosa]
MSRLLALLGIVLTIAYAVFMCFIFGNPLPVLKEMELNSVGDFLAGVFGPVAILWLILGFFQQGLELRQNNEALKMQADELRASVEQQAAMADSQRVTLANHGKAMEPLLKLSAGDIEFFEGERYLNLKLENHGEYCERVTVEYPGIGFTRCVDCLFEGDSCILSFGVDEFDNGEVNVRYVNRLGIAGFQGFKVSQYFHEDGNGYIVEKKPFLS